MSRLFSTPESTSQELFPLFSIDPSYLELAKPFVDKATKEGAGLALSNFNPQHFQDLLGVLGGTQGDHNTEMTLLFKKIRLASERIDGYKKLELSNAEIDLLTAFLKKNGRENLSVNRSKKEEVVLALDFDDTIIKHHETTVKKTPVINESLVHFLVDLFAHNPDAQFKIIILSARAPDSEFHRETHPCLLISSALPIFLRLLNAELEKKSLSNKIVTSIDEQNIYCIQGENGFVKRTYSYFSGNVSKSFSKYYWRRNFRHTPDAELHRILIAGRLSGDVVFTHEDEACLDKGPFLAMLLKKMGASYCLHVDDNVKQIESVYTHAKDFVRPVMVCCRPHPSQMLVAST